MGVVFKMDDQEKTSTPIFSVIIPAYNAEKFIHIAVESVQKQTVEDWELIIVENGSTDYTTVVCEKFLSDRRIILLHSEKGVSAARNAGIKAARGTWLIFLDADDQLLNDSLQKYLEIDDEYSPGMIIGEYEDKKIKYNCDKQLYQGDALREVLYISLENPTQKCNTKAVAFRNSIVQHHGIMFDTQIKYAEDSVFFLEMLKYSEKVVAFFNPVYRVIYYSQSAVRSGKRKLEKEYLPAINRIGEILDLSDSAVKNEWYIFILNQLLVILVNDIFSRQESTIQQIKDARDAMDIPEYKKAINNVNLSNLHGMKKIVIKMMKMRFMLGILLAVRIRQRQNKKKEDMFYV